MPNERAELSDEQRLYARWLDVCTRVGFTALLATFLVYLSGVLPSAIPFDALPRVWGLPVAQYVAATGAPTGWRWLAQLGHGDVLNFASVAIIASATLLCYARVLWAFMRARDRLYAVICLAEIVVLAAAASGFAGGAY